MGEWKKKCIGFINITLCLSAMVYILQNNTKEKITWNTKKRVTPLSMISNIPWLLFLPIFEGKNGKGWTLSHFYSKLSPKTQGKKRNGRYRSLLNGQVCTPNLGFIGREWCWQGIPCVINASKKLHQCRADVLLSFFWHLHQPNLSASASDHQA